MARSCISNAWISADRRFGRSGKGPWAEDLRVKVDHETLHALDPLPACPRCGGLARPNILMFSDWEWDPRRTNEQGIRLNEWLEQNEEAKLCIIELGAGPNIDLSVSRPYNLRTGMAFLRWNLSSDQPATTKFPRGFFSPTAVGAKEALQAIEEFRKRRVIRAFLG